MCWVTPIEGWLPFHPQADITFEHVDLFPTEIGGVVSLHIEACGLRQLCDKTAAEFQRRSAPLCHDRVRAEGHALISVETVPDVSAITSPCRRKLNRPVTASSLSNLTVENASR